MLWYTARVRHRLAQDTADQIKHYQKSGITDLGIVGLDASPLFGVHKSLNMRVALRRVGRLKKDTAKGEDVNQIVITTVNPDRGL